MIGKIIFNYFIKKNQCRNRKGIIQISILMLPANPGINWTDPVCSYSSRQKLIKFLALSLESTFFNPKTICYPKTVKIQT
jgi:hypothetical protein